MTANDPLSRIHLQVMWNRLLAVVEEQAQVLIRTGFSTSTREAGDVSAGVFDLDGRAVAQLSGQERPPRRPGTRAHGRAGAAHGRRQA